jgi:hypothetical protein
VNASVALNLRGSMRACNNCKALTIHRIQESGEQVMGLEPGHDHIGDPIEEACEM